MEYPEKPRIPPKSILFVFSVGVVLLGAVILELALQLFNIRVPTMKDWANLPTALSSYSEYLSFRLPNNVNYPHKTYEFNVVYQLNSHGYRGQFPKTIKKPEGIRRWIALGDSFTLGWGNPLKDTYVELLQQALGKSYQVINAAYRAGYSPDSYYAYLLKEGRELSPDGVFLFIYEDNDLRDIQDNRWLETDSTGAPTKLRTIRLYADYLGNLLNPSMLPWNYHIRVLNLSKVFMGLSFLANQLLGIENPRYSKVGSSVSEQKAWERFQISVKAIRQFCEKNGIAFVVATIPRKRDKKFSKQTHEKINQFLTTLPRTTHLNLLPYLSMEHYFPVDLHLNAMGNQVVARVVCDALQQNSFAPCKLPPANRLQ